MKADFLRRPNLTQNLSLINPLVFAIFIKIRRLTSSENSIADKFAKMLEKGG